MLFSLVAFDVLGLWLVVGLGLVLAVSIRFVGVNYVGLMVVCDVSVVLIVLVFPFLLPLELLLC